METVNLVSQERLDLNDAKALQGLGYEYALRALGGLFGAGGGCVAPFSVASHENDGAGAYWANLSAFAFYHSQGYDLRPSSLGGSPDVYSTHKGRVVRLEPDGQSVQAVYTAARNAAAAYLTANPAEVTVPDGTANALPWLWARPLAVEEDEDARKQWSMDVLAEVNITIPTRIRDRAEFQFSDTMPDAAGGLLWVRVGRLVSWAISGGGPASPTTPTLRPWSMWDDPALATWVGESTALANGSTSQAGLLTLLTGGAVADYELEIMPDDNRDLGLVRMLWLIRNRLRRHLGEGSGDPVGTPNRSWLHVPKYSLRGLQKLLDDDLVPRVEDLEARPLPWAAYGVVGVTRNTIANFDPEMAFYNTTLNTVDFFGEDIEAVVLKFNEADPDLSDGYALVTFKDAIFSGIGYLTGPKWHISVVPKSDAATDAVAPYFATFQIIGDRQIRVHTFRQDAGGGPTPMLWHFWVSFTVMLHGPGAGTDVVTPVFP